MQSNPCVRHVIVAQGALAQSQTRRDQWPTFEISTSKAPITSSHSCNMRKLSAVSVLHWRTPKWQRSSHHAHRLPSTHPLRLLCGNGGFATQHIRFGRRLLNAWRLSVSEAANQLMPPQIPPDSIDEGLAEMFIRLDIQSLCAMASIQTVTTTHASLDSPHIPVPLEFSNLEEARHARLQLLNDGYKFWLRTLKYNFLPATQVRRKCSTREITGSSNPSLEQCSGPSPPKLRFGLTNPSSCTTRRSKTENGCSNNPIEWHTPCVGNGIRLSLPPIRVPISIAQDVMEYERTHSDLGAATGMNPAGWTPRWDGEQQLQGNLRTADVESYCWEDRIVPPLY